MSELISGTTPRSPVKANSPYKVYRQGWLLKSPPRSVRKKLHRYWFVLFKQKDMLAFLYFADEDHYLDRKKNEGFFRIDDCTSIDVIPEHLGRKNAFCISTPRSKYHLVSESRYELHHWLLALHGAMDDYKNRTPQHTAASNGSSSSNTSTKKKHHQQQQQTTKQRSHSTSTSPSASLSRTYPRIKPSRPAPPAPPKDKKKGDEENIPPLNVPLSDTNNESPLHNLPSPTTNKLDDIVAGLLQESQGPTTLDYTMTEDDELPPLTNGDDNEEEETGSLSMSLPMLNNSNKATVTSNPVDSNSDENTSPSVHTRHLSFSDSYEFQANKGSVNREGRKKSSKKRSASVKVRRSISPPNLPPPPPPPTDEPSTDYNNGENVINSFEQDQALTNQTFTAKSSPKPPPPQRTTSLNPQTVDTEVGKYLDEAFSQEDSIPSLGSMENGKSPGILRKGEHKSPKRNVVFDEQVKSGRYEPMVDHESLPSTVAEAKARLFGGTEETVESYRYKRQDYLNVVEPQDELLEAIETALQPTSYMEQKKQQQQNKVGFSIDVGPPSIPPPIRSPPYDDGNTGEGYVLQTSPTETTSSNNSSSHPPESMPVWTKPSIDDAPTITTFTANPDTMYRSMI